VESLEGDATSKGAKVSLPEFGDFISVAFSTEEGEISSLVANDTNTAYYLLRVDGVTPPRIKTLDEVRGEVVDAWKATQRKRALQERTIEVSKALLAGETTMEK